MCVCEREGECVLLLSRSRSRSFRYITSLRRKVGSYRRELKSRATFSYDAGCGDFFLIVISLDLYPTIVFVFVLALVVLHSIDFFLFYTHRIQQNRF